MNLHLVSPVLLLIVSVLSNVTNTLSKRVYLTKAKFFQAALWFNAIGSVVSCIALGFCGGFSSASDFSVWFGVLFGVVTALQAVFYLLALKKGPTSSTAVITSLSMILPTLSGAIWWGESIEIAQIFGIVMLVACIVLSGWEKGGKGSLVWLLLCMGSFVFCGGVGIMQKVHQTSAYAGEITPFLTVAFASSSLVSFAVIGVMTLLKRQKEIPQEDKNLQPVSKNKQEDGKKSWIVWVIVIASGLFTAINNLVNLHLSGVMDSAVFFPVFNGSCLVAVALASLLVFREKLSITKWIGAAVGIVAVILLCNPFG